MILENDVQLQNTIRKLAELEQRFEEAKSRPMPNPTVRELTLRSLKQTMNQLKEDIVRYQANQKPSAVR
jgi:hypothetical protein